jgi:hypothetical protein
MGLDVVSVTPSGVCVLGGGYDKIRSMRCNGTAAAVSFSMQQLCFGRARSQPHKQLLCNPPPNTAAARQPRAPPTPGTPPVDRKPWTSQVEWVRGSALEPRTYQHLLPGALGAVSCVGGFGSNAAMLQVNGAANAAAIAAAKAAGVPRFAYVSAHIPDIPGFEYLMQGYVQGKRQAEEELAREYPDGGRRSAGLVGSGSGPDSDGAVCCSGCRVA